MKIARIELLKGDITERATDAIVNTANSRLLLGSGLGGAIKAKGGSSIARECAGYGEVEIGSAVITKGGKLKARSVIHAVVSEFDGEILEENIAKALRSTLKLANKHRLKSISIPDFSVGIKRFSPLQCAQTMFRVLRDFLESENKTLELIEIVLWDIDSLRLYKSVFSTYFKQDST
jgi:O-acetyl-ADP-ribose deacetylase (regulator of RNase III)